MKKTLSLILLIGLTSHLLVAEPANHTAPKHVIRTKRVSSRPAIYSFEINGTAFRDFQSLRRYIESLPAGSVLVWRSPTLFIRLPLDQPQPKVTEFEALCAARGITCDFQFGCYF